MQKWHNNAYSKYSILLEDYADPDIYNRAAEWQKRFKVGDIIRIEREHGAAFITKVIKNTNNPPPPYYLAIIGDENEFNYDYAFALFVTHETNKANRFIYYMVGPYVDEE